MPLAGQMGLAGGTAGSRKNGRLNLISLHGEEQSSFTRLKSVYLLQEYLSTSPERMPISGCCIETLYLIRSIYSVCAISSKRFSSVLPATFDICSIPFVVVALSFLFFSLGVCRLFLPPECSFVPWVTIRKGGQRLQPSSRAERVRGVSRKSCQLLSGTRR